MKELMEKLIKLPSKEEGKSVLIIKETHIFFRYAQPADKYTNEYENEPDHFDLRKIENEITKFLEDKGKFIMEAKRPLPFIEEGFVTAPINWKCYALEHPEDKSPYLIFQGTRPSGGFYNPGLLYSLVVVGYKENKDKVDGLLDYFRSVIRWICGGFEKWSDVKTKLVSTNQIQNIEDILTLPSFSEA